MFINRRCEISVAFSAIALNESAQLKTTKIREYSFETANGFSYLITQITTGNEIHARLLEDNKNYTFQLIFFETSHHRVLTIQNSDITYCSKTWGLSTKNQKLLYNQYDDHLTVDKIRSLIRMAKDNPAPKSYKNHIYVEKENSVGIA